MTGQRIQELTAQARSGSMSQADGVSALKEVTDYITYAYNAGVTLTPAELQMLEQLLITLLPILISLFGGSTPSAKIGP